MKEAHSESSEPPSGTSIDALRKAPSMVSEGSYGRIERQGALRALPGIGRMPHTHSTCAALGSIMCSAARIGSDAFRRSAETGCAKRPPVLP